LNALDIRSRIAATLMFIATLTGSSGIGSSYQLGTTNTGRMRSALRSSHSSTRVAMSPSLAGTYAVGVYNWQMRKPHSYARSYLLPLKTSPDGKTGGGIAGRHSIQKIG